MALLLGAIADDFTGATDLANTLVKAGMRITQIIGVPEDEMTPAGSDAVVIALKSRTAPVDQAIGESLRSLEWLQGNGAHQIFFKYCSTFDSTSKGNIGPVTDALMERLGADFTIICPAFPENGRTVYKGNLFVGDLPLAESSMKDHPLTPMRDSSLIRLMDAQSGGTTGLIPLQIVRRGLDAIRERIASLFSDGHKYGIADAIDESDLQTLGRAVENDMLVTGGSALAIGLPGNFRRRGLLATLAAPRYPSISGRSLVLAGSCSTATRSQIAHVRDRWPCRRIEIDDLAAGKDVVGGATGWALAQPAERPVLVYASSDPQQVFEAQQKYGAERAGEMVEKALGAISSGLVSRGFSRVIVAGGETSGAVVSALGVRALEIGPEIDPGVPWTK